MMKHSALLISAYVLAIICLGSCSGKREGNGGDGGCNIFEEASFIRGTRLTDSSLIISVVNPWDTTAMLARYRLVNRRHDDAGTAATPDIPTLRLPLRRMIVYSSVHASLLAELGQIDRIAGVADARYISNDSIRARVADGRIADIGSSTEPSFEKIVALKPDAILISPFENAGHGVADRTGVPVIECADYMEQSPLGRTEWSRFYAMLAEGIGDTNSRIYNSVKARYDSLRAIASAFPDTPEVITEMPEKGVWSLPGGGSYAARLIEDANARLAVDTGGSTGSVPVPYEKALIAAENADFWLIKTFGHDITPAEIIGNNPLNGRLKACREGNGIYNANTAVTPLFDDISFHPDRILQEYITIFHRTPDSLHYFHPVIMK